MAVARLIANTNFEPQNLQAGLDKIGSYLVGATGKRIALGGFTQNSVLTVSVKGSTKPLNDRGLLKNSLTHRVEGGSVIIGTNHPAAGLLHRGGTITAKSAKTLLIPASSWTRALQRSLGFSPRDVLEGLVGQGYKIIWRPRAVLAQKGKEKASLVFIRRTSVTIPARPFLMPDQKDLSIIGSMLTNYLMGGFNRGGQR